MSFVSYAAESAGAGGAEPVDRDRSAPAADAREPGADQRLSEGAREHGDVAALDGGREPSHFRMLMLQLLQILLSSSFRFHRIDVNEML